MIRSFSPLFWISLLLFGANQILERFITIPWLHAYLDDILCGPIVLGAVLTFFQKLLSTPDYKLPISSIVFFWVWYSLFFEVIYPSYDLRHYQDIWDVAAYALGSLLFFKFGNKPLSALAVKAPNEEEKNAVQTG